MLRLAALIALFALLHVGPAAAAPIHLQVEDASSLILAATTSQKVISKTETLHEITVTLDLGASLALYRKLGARLSNNGAPMTDLSMTLTYLTSTMAVSEMREYLQVTVSDIRIAALDAATRVPVQAVVRMQARGMRLIKSDRLNSTIGAKPSSILSSAFRFGVATFDAGRIERVSALSLVPCAQRLCDSILQFEIIVVGDAISNWRAKLEDVSRGLTTTFDGQLALLTSDMSSELMRFELASMVPITIIDEAPTASGAKSGPSQPRATVRLRALRVRTTF
ncbi:MAG TPA: hypothetical protein VNA88_05560 [Candidatus Kapabacteria bacterium]|nr:hypothetical protein [Candidatus Kapabacteria bacterium]